MSVVLIHIRWSKPLTMLTLPKPILEFSYITASIFFPATIDRPDLSPKSINYVIKVMHLYCDTISIGNTLYRYELIWSWLSTTRSMSSWARESTFSYTHKVCNGLTIAANYRSLNLTTLYWSEIYSNLPLSCFAIHWMESILCHSAHMNHMSYLAQPRRCGWNKGGFV